MLQDRKRGSKKLSIYIAAQDSGGLGGAEQYIYQLSKEFIKSGCKVRYATVGDSRFDKYLKKKKVKPENILVRMDVVGGWKGLVKFFFFLPYSLIWNYLSLKRFADNGGNIVIVPGVSNKFIITPLAKMFGLGVVWLQFGSLEPLVKRNLGIPKLFYKLIKDLPDFVVVSSKYTQKCFSSKAQIDESKIKLIYCGLKMLPKTKVNNLRNKAMVVRKKMGLNKKFVVGMISRIEKEKGQDTLVKTVNILKKKIPNIYALIVGEGDDQPLRDLIKKFNLENHVELEGYVKDKYLYYAMFDVCVFPTRWKLEGFGLVLVEAMMMKTPLVASSSGPVPEVVGNTVTICDPNSREIAKSIYKVYKNPKRSKSMVIKAEKRARNNFSIQKSAREFLRLFEKLLLLRKIYSHSFDRLK